MPRIIAKGTNTPPSWFQDLVSELRRELKEGHEFGQPVIHEEHFPKTGKIRATVLWDKWEGVPHEVRADAIQRAYAAAEGPEFGDKLALVVGLTYPEAYEEGIVPFQVVPLLRKSDPVTSEQCLDAMSHEGASKLFQKGLQLRFMSMEEAEASKNRLIERLPGSEAVWAITQDVGRFEPAS